MTDQSTSKSHSSSVSPSPSPDPGSSGTNSFASVNMQKDVVDDTEEDEYESSTSGSSLNKPTAKQAKKKKGLSSR